jgi:hypothetical protein
MIAYQVVGEGQPRDLVIAPGTVSHLNLELEYWPDVVREYGAVMDAAGSERAFVPAIAS